MQARSLEPMKMFASLAAETMEQVVRKNYEVAGDVIDFSVKQMNLPLSGENVSDIASAQATEARAFGELMGARANEYLEMANAFGSKMRETTEEAVSTIKSDAA